MKPAKKSLLWTGIVGIGFVILITIFFASTPAGRMIFKGIQTGLIFHPKAYSASLFSSNSKNLLLDKIDLPPGFQIEVYAQNIPNARSLTLSEKGTLFVGTRNSDKVYALLDRDMNFEVEDVFIIAKSLNMPNGVAVKDGALYVAEVS